MQLLLVAILLLIVPPAFAQDNISSPSSIIIQNDLDLDATKSATTSALDTATPSAIKPIMEDNIQEQESTPSSLIDQDTTQTALIYTGIMVLILIAFLAGRKSSELDNSE